MKRRKVTVVITALLFLTVCNSPTQAASRNPSCPEELAGRGKIIPSGRDNDVLGQYQEIIEVLFGAGGVMTKLGIQHPEHVMHFMPGNEISCLSANNHHALPHWHDGANIVSALTRGSGTLEFVCPSGCPLRSFYKDTLSVEQQLSIILHVAGHYHFMTHTRLQQIRDIDLHSESYRLAELMRQLNQTEDPDEVSRWYQYLLTLAWSQDVSRGQRSLPEDFSSERLALGFFQDRENRDRVFRIPTSPTPNILQAIVANMPTTLPPWKIEMAQRFERVNRYMSGAIPTKIINEGFATIMQELAVEHLPEKYRTLKFGIEQMHLHQGVTRPGLQNPYWFGREIYRSLRRRFNDRPEMQKLRPLERDRRFIEYVTREVIESKDQYDSILFAMDGPWFHKHKLGILRPANFDEWDPNLPPPKDHDEDDEALTQHRVVTKDPERLARQLARKVADWERVFPRVVLSDLNDAESGNAVFGFVEGSFGAAMPLQRDSMVTTLLVHSRIIGRPVQLQTVKSSTWVRKIPIDDFDNFRIFGPRLPPGWPPRWPPRWPNDPESDHVTLTEIRVVVSPQGKVKVYELATLVVEKPIPEKPAPEKSDGKADDKTEPKKTEMETWNEDPQLTLDLQERLDKFLADIDIGRTQHRADLTGSHVSEIAASIANSVPTGLLFHAPTAPEAIHHYYMELNRRMAIVLEQALRGDRTLVRTKLGVAVKALATIPTFAFDKNVMKALGAEKAPKDPAWQVMAIDNPYNDDDNYNLGQTDKDPGENDWGPDPKEGGGKGDGIGDGKGDPGDPSDKPGDDPSDGQGFDPNDPSWVVIPPELYAEFLGEKIELPRLRPKGGISPLTDRTREGAAARRDGETAMNEVARKALLRELAVRDPESQGLSRAELLRRGFRRLQPQDWRVRSFETDPNPDINAVVFFMMDGSGSMSGKRLAVAKKLIYDLKAILKKHYPKIEYRFVTFDTRGTIHENEDDFFKLELLGGTDYLSGIAKVKEAQEKFPRAQWDRYVIGVGDLEDAGVDEIISKFRELAEQSEFAGMVRTVEFDGWFSQLADRFKALAAEDEYIGYLDLAPALKYAPGDFRKLFKNEKK